MKKIIVAGIGPGSREDITPAVTEAFKEADAVVGYKYYFQFVEPYLKAECECIDTGMKKERERAAQAFELAEQGKTVVVISSGDAGIYGMAPLVFEMKQAHQSDVEIETLPGISAFQKAASLLGAPIGHDMCILGVMLGKAVKLAAGHLDTHSRKTTMDKDFIRQLLHEADCDIDISDITLARELWERLPADQLDTFANAIIHHCAEHCNPLLPNGSLTILLIDDNGKIYEIHRPVY